jgi:DnaJ family protein A protein 5
VSSYGESESDREEELEAAVNSLYCVACNKLFKTEKAFSNHENSKKHKDSVEVLKASMLDEEEELAVSENKQRTEDLCDYLEISSLSGISSNSDTSSQDELDKSESLEVQSERTHKKRSKNRIPNICNITDDSTSDAEFQMSSGLSKKQRKKQWQMMQVQQSIPSGINTEENGAGNNNADSTAGENLSEIFDIFAEKVKGKKTKVVKKENKLDVPKEGKVYNRKEVADGIKEEGKSDYVEIKNKRAKGVKKVGSKVGSDGTDNLQDLNHCCITCRSEFPSKNKLFDHLKKTGHSVFIPYLAERSTKERLEDRVKTKAKNSK